MTFIGEEILQLFKWPICHSHKHSCIGIIVVLISKINGIQMKFISFSENVTLNVGKDTEIYLN